MADQQELSVDEVYARLKEAVDRGSRDVASTRGLAERFWPVSADKPLERRPGPKGWLAFQVKRVLRKLMRWYVEPAFAEQRIVNDALLRLVGGLARRVEAVIATKFPSYAVRHPRKVVWLLHQFRQAWDLDRTSLGQFSESAEDRALRRRVLAFERTALGEARAIFATSGNVAGRLKASTGLDAELMPHPPASLAYRCDRYDDFILSVNRLDRAKRIDLLL